MRLPEAIIETETRPWRIRVQNLLASWSLLAVVIALYSQAAYLRPPLSQPYRMAGLEFTPREFLIASALVYGLVLLVYYLTERDPQTSKSVHCLRAPLAFLRDPVGTWRTGLPPEQRLGVLATLLKAFFTPLMIVWLLDHTVHMVANGLQVLGDPERIGSDFLGLFDAHGFWFLLQLIIFVDVFFFTIGYMIELPSLRNEIRSVDPTWLGWAAALLCYPPFNHVTSTILGWQASDFPHFESPTAHLVLNLLLLALMGIYASASVALNFKASNLTHRGIVSRGPYAFIRHPAYVCKNLAWWIGATPALAAALERSLWSAVLVGASVIGWSLIYLLRALTEEDHLRRVDGEYDAYCARVRYRFIPGVV